MNKKNTSYRMPEGFNPYSAIDEARGLADAVHWMHFEGPGAAETMAFGDKVSLDALVEMLRARIHDLHDYIHELGNSTSLHLPMNDAELDALRYKGSSKGGDFIREEPPLYLVR